MRKRLLIGLAVLVFLAVAAGLLYNLPPIHDRLAWRIEAIQSQIKYALSPPEESVFVPQGNVDDFNNEIATMVAATLQVLTPTATPGISLTPTQTPPLDSTPTATPTALPGSVTLPGVVYVDQHHRWNYCGPANLAMALKYWGWEGKHDDIAAVIKPGVDDEEKDFIERGKTDKNVMPSEMLDFVNENTAYRALSRFGGDEDLVKRLIAAGFPVLIEKAYYEEDYTGKIAWMGHYLFVTGYDDAKAAFTVQDAYLKTGKNGTGQDLLSDYPTFLEGWRSFNYLFMVVYPPEQEAQVLSLLGSWADEPWANQHALDLADQEIQHNTGNDLFFAWFNKGTSHVQLGQYPEAAGAFDRAFQIYAGLGSDDKQRPYRIMWYQTWPYWAYFYTGRYQDVINLADTTLNETIDKPTLEESLYWRGMGEWALGNVSAAIADFQQSVYYNPHFTAGLVQLQELGAAP